MRVQRRQTCKQSTLFWAAHAWTTDTHARLYARTRTPLSSAYVCTASADVSPESPVCAHACTHPRTPHAFMDTSRLHEPQAQVHTMAPARMRTPHMCMHGLPPGECADPFPTPMHACGYTLIHMHAWSATCQNGVGSSYRHTPHLHTPHNRPVRQQLRLHPNISATCAGRLFQHTHAHPCRRVS